MKKLLLAALCAASLLAQAKLPCTQYGNPARVYPTTCALDVNSALGNPSQIVLVLQAPTFASFSWAAYQQYLDYYLIENYILPALKAYPAGPPQTVHLEQAAQWVGDSFTLNGGTFK